MNGNPFFVKPADYTGAMNMLSQGMSSLAESNQKKAQQQQQEEMMAGLQSAVESGDLNSVADFMIANPQISSGIRENVFAGMKLKDDAQKERVKRDTFEILSNPQGVEAILTRRIEDTNAQGGDPTESIRELEIFRANPERYMQTVEGVAASSFAPEYKLWAEAMTRGQPEQMTEYQAGTLAVQQQQNRLRELELEEKKLDRQAARAKTEAQTAEVEAKREAVKAEKQELQAQDKTKIESSIFTAEQNIETINNLLSNEDYMDSLTGWQGRAPAVSDSGVEAEAYFDNIKNSLTIENLGVMSGPLTDKDIQVIASAASRIRTGMSEQALTKELNTIKAAYNRVINNYKKEADRKGYELETTPAKTKSQNQTAIISGDYTSLWGG